MVWKFKDGDKVSFNTIDSHFCAMNGCLCTIVRKVTEKEADLFEVGPMYVIEFPDGSKAQAFEDELDGSQCGMPVNVNLMDSFYKMLDEMRSTMEEYKPYIIEAMEEGNE